MKLNLKALAYTGAILWGGCLALTAILNLIFRGYGATLLRLADSIYPGYHGPNGVVGVLVVTLYGLVDGAICGALIAWLYNRFAASA